VPEIVVGSAGSGFGAISAFDGQGTMRPGWPFYTASPVIVTAALLDLTGDGVREVVVPDEDGTFYALDGQGRLLGGWPYTLLGGLGDSPVAGAGFGPGGTTEMILGRFPLGLVPPQIEEMRAILFGPPSPAAPWRTFKGNPARTGYAPDGLTEQRKRVGVRQP
jgi:hypothetical protein